MVVADAFGRRIFCMTEGLCGSLTVLGTEAEVQFSLLVLSWPRLAAELFLLLDSRYELFALTDGLGLFLAELRFPTVAEIGNRGGGICSLLILRSTVFSDVLAFESVLEVLRFHDKLNFLRKELIEDGVGGSSGSEIGGVGDFAFTGRWARGPEGFCGGFTSRGSVIFPRSPVCDLFRKAGSAPGLGTEEDRNGDTLGFLVAL